MPAWALVVGINKYHPKSRLSDLHGAVADAADFADWAIDPSGGGVDPANLFFWTYPAPATMGAHLEEFMKNPTEWPLEGPEFHRAPRAEEIAACSQMFAESAVSAGATRLYVFLAGHGGQTTALDHREEPQNCFMAGNYRHEFQKLGLVSCDDMKRQLSRIGPSELLLFFDCCRSELPLRVGAPPDHYERNSDLQLHERLGVGHAALPKTRAFEVPIGHPSPERGAFSQLLVGGLRSHRVDGQLTFAELKGYVTSGVTKLVEPETQNPHFYAWPEKDDLIIVAGAPEVSDFPVNLSFSTLNIGEPFVVRDAKAQVVLSDSVDGSVKTVQLPAGEYVVEGEDGSFEIFRHFPPGPTHVTF